MSHISNGPSHGTCERREGGGLTRRSRGRPAAVVGCSHGVSPARLLRATAAMRIAAMGSTMALGDVGPELKPPSTIVGGALLVVRLAWSD